MLTNFFYILVAVLMLGIIILVHELGHFLVAKLCKVQVEEFAVGMGMKLFSREHKGVLYSLRAIPIGGFCRFAQDIDSPSDSLSAAPIRKRFPILIAGVFMNFALAFLCAVIMLYMYTVADVLPQVDTVLNDSPAQIAQLQVGDIITEVNSIPISYNYEGVALLRDTLAEADSVTLTVRRGNTAQTITLTPELVTDEVTGQSAKQIGIYFKTRTCTLPEALRYGGVYMWDTTKDMLQTLKNLFFKGEGMESVTGPVGTISLVSEIVRSDSRMFLQLLFLISLNLGIVNLLPLPGLDGGRLVFLLVEAVRCKPVPPDKEGMVHAVGMLLLLLLAVLLTWHDIVNIIL